MIETTSAKSFDFREFWELPIFNGKEPYFKTTFDKINASLLYGRLTESSKSDDLAIVLPTDPSVTPILILESLLALLKLDVLTNTREVLANVKPGDNVGVIDRRVMKPGIYKGRETDSAGITRHCVEFDTFIHKIPIGMQWKIQPYRVAMTSKKKRSAVVLGKKLEELMELPPGGLLAFQKSKALIVSSEKSRIIDSLKDLNLDGDRMDNIFPMENWTSDEQAQTIGQNYLRRSPILGFVSNTDVAVDIALKDPDIRLIIIDGASKIKNYGSIELLNADKYPRKIICLLKSTDTEELKTLSQMGFDCWVWRRSDFLAMPEVLQKHFNHNGIFSVHNKIMYSLAGGDPIYKEVTVSTEIIKIMSEIRKKLQMLKTEIESDEAGILLRWSYSIFYSLLQLPMSIKSFHKYLEDVPSGDSQRLDTKLFELRRSFQNAYGVLIRSDLIKDCEELLADIQKIYDFLEDTNPKEKAILYAINNNYYQSTDLIFGKQEYASAFRSTHNLGDNINTVTQAELGLRPKNLCIITGWANNRLAAKSYLAPYKKIMFICYLNELNSYKNAERSTATAYATRIDGKLRSNLNRIIKVRDEERHLENESFASLDKLFDDLKLKYGEEISREYSAHQHELVDSRRILMEDDSYLYLDDSHYIDKLDRDNKTYKKCHLKDLEVGDELIFASTEKGLFEDLLSIIKESEDYQELHSKALLWKRALENFALMNNYDEHDIAEKLKLAGCSRHPSTIQSWFDGSIIGPSSDNYRAIYAISDLTKDELLTNNLDQTITSCKKLHALHVNTGRALVRRIINATIQAEDQEVDEKVKAKIDLYATNARVLPVVAISDSTVRVPMPLIGKLRSI